MGGEGYFLFDTGDLQMLLKSHDFPVFFLIFFLSNVFMRLLENYKFPNLQSGEKYAYLQAFVSWSAERPGSEARAPLTFWKSLLQRKRKKEREKK